MRDKSKSDTLQMPLFQNEPTGNAQICHIGSRITGIMAIMVRGVMEVMGVMV